MNKRTYDASFNDEILDELYKLDLKDKAKPPTTAEIQELSIVRKDTNKRQKVVKKEYYTAKEVDELIKDRFEEFEHKIYEKYIKLKKMIENISEENAYCSYIA